MKRALVTLLAVALLVGGLSLGAQAKEKDTLPVLRRKLLEAQDAEAIDKALHALALKIGQPAFFADHGAFADWLGTVPDGRADHTLVRRHRGWALVRAKRGDEAIPHLELALKDNPSDGLTRAWLADGLRQGKRFMEAAEMLAAAVRCGAKGTYVDDTIVSIIFKFRAEKISGHADDLPEYVLAAHHYLRVKPDPKIDHMVARALLDDFKVFEQPDRTRGKSWALTASLHALAATKATEPLAGLGQLVYDAAKALEYLDTETGGNTLRFDLLAAAYKIGADRTGGPNRSPDVVVWLAEGAAKEGRFELAHRLVQERLEISDSPRARRLLAKLPPDLGSDG